jgi:hypothetical protein
MKILAAIFFFFIVTSAISRAEDEIILHCPSVTDAQSGNFSPYFRAVYGHISSKPQLARTQDLAKIESFLGAELFVNNEGEGLDLRCAYSVGNDDEEMVGIFTSDEAGCVVHSGPWEEDGNIWEIQNCDGPAAENCAAVCLMK